VLKRSRQLAQIALDKLHIARGIRREDIGIALAEAALVDDIHERMPDLLKGKTPGFLRGIGILEGQAGIIPGIPQE
jgi:hypothetical protein